MMKMKHKEFDLSFFCLGALATARFAADNSQ